MSDKQSTINAIWDQADRDADAANREMDEFIKSIDAQIRSATPEEWKQDFERFAEIVKRVVEANLTIERRATARSKFVRNPDDMAGRG